MADPKIRYDIEAGVTGTDDLGKLADETRRLGDTLEGSLKKETIEAANALDQLGKKQAAIQLFTTLRRTTQDLAVGLDAATASVDRLGAELPEAAAATARLAQEERAARDQLAELRALLDTTRAQQKQLRTATDESTRSTEQFKEAQQRAAALAKQLADQIKIQGANVKDVTLLSKEARDTERSLTGEHERALAAAQRLSREYNAQRAALDGARTGMQALGVETTGLAKTQRAVETGIATLRERITSLAPAWAGAGAAARAASEKQAAAAKEAAEAAARAAKEAKKAEEGAASLGDAFKRLGPILAASFTGREFLETIVQAESLKRGLTAITGSSEAASQEIEYLRATSNRLGLELQTASQAYLSLSAATKGTAIEGEKTRALFEAISLAMGTLGKSSAETERALTAVQQMASKGTVSMEELRGQLGEALPGALAAAAAGAGLTTAELIKMVESGDVLAKDLLPALTKGLNDLYAQGGPPEGIISNWNRLKNAISEAAVAVGEGGASTGITYALKGAVVGFTKVNEAVQNVGADLGEMAGAVATGNAQLFTQADRLRESEERLNKVRVAAGLANLVTHEFGNAAAASGDAVRESFRRSEIAAQNASDAVVDSALKQKQAFQDLTQEATKRLEQSKKGAEAADAEAKTIELIASAFGTETDRRTASTLAATLQRDAQVKLSEARRADLALTEQKLAALDKEIAGTAKYSPELEGQKKALEQSVSVKREEVRASEAMAAAHGVAATAARVATETYRDNSLRVGELKTAYDAATLAVEQLQAKQKTGQATAAQVAAAVLQQAAAQKLYNDALRDAVEAAEVHEKVQARKATAAAAEADLNIEAARTTLEVAKARGDDAAAAGAQVRVTNLEIEAKRQAAQALREEAIAMRETATAREREAIASGTLTTAKKEEIAALRASADGKDLDARKSDLLAQREAALATATRNSAASIVDALEKRVSAQERLNAVNERAAALEAKRIGVDKEGFATGKDGQRIVAGGDLTSLTGIAAFLKSAGVDDDAQARSIAREFANSRGEVTSGVSQGQLRYGGAGSTISQALLRAAESVTFGRAATPGTTTIPQAAENRTVNFQLNLNGQSYGALVTDAQGATSLQNFLGQLQNAKATAA